MVFKKTQKYPTKASSEIIPESSTFIIHNVFDNSWAHLTFSQIIYISLKSRNDEIQV